MIDWQQIKQLEEDIGPEDFSDVVILFLEEVDSTVEELKTAPPESAEELAPVLHFLKGSAYNLGFREFGDYCSDGERLVLEGQGQRVALDNVIRLYTKSKQQFFADAPLRCSFRPQEGAV